MGTIGCIPIKQYYCLTAKTEVQCKLEAIKNVDKLKFVSVT